MIQGRHFMNSSTNKHLLLGLALVLIFSESAIAAAPAGRAESTPAAAQAVQPTRADAPANVDPCEKERPLDTADACAEFLRACPSASQRRDVLALMFKLIEAKKGGYEEYRKYALEFDDGMPFVPYRHRLQLIGPEGLRVHDCIEALKSGEEHGIVLENVRRKNGIYRDFSLEEIETLKQMGLTGDIIQAMIESTLDAERAETNRTKRASAVYAPVSQMGGGGVYSSGGQQSIQGQYVPPVNNAIANCAAQAAALGSCRRMSGLARSICESTAKIQFPCQ